MDLFFELFEPLPRQGPGNLASTQRALELCEALADEPSVLDLGCGAGAQTLDLARITDGAIVAIDAHPPLIERLTERAEREGVSERIEARVADMSQLDVPDGSIDLVWSEGALYNLGLERALPMCMELLRPGGYLCFTDAVWLTDAPHEQVREAFAEYETMGRVEDALQLASDGGWAVVGHFMLPDEAWWEDFYSPMEARIEELREAYSGDDEAQEILDELAAEPEMHRRHGQDYNYAFIVLRKPE